MSHHLKRILIIFSVALNIGFAITAVVLYYNPPSHPHHRYWAFALETMKRLDLPPEQNRDVTTYMDQFKQKMSTTMEAFHQAHIEKLKVLSKPGPLNQKEFNKANNAFKHIVERKHQEIQNHVLTMRQKLGDEKGAQFFSEMLAKVKSHKRHH